MKPLLADHFHCTGCAACANICAQDAIRMLPDREGFLQPHIAEDLCVGCGRCEKVCPVLHPQYKNEKITSCYAAWTDDTIRKISSTAGAFLVLAQSVIQDGGIVYGAAWTEDWHVHHIGIESSDELFRLQGSKYLQSEISNSYKEVKVNLNNKRKVLFSGCPCQVAGLYAYLGKQAKTPELFTIEIICHGVPSPLAFQKYLKDSFGAQIEHISNINLRDKSVFGWSTTSNIYFDNAESYHKNTHEDAFLGGFLPCMILRNSCSSCPFSQLPRQADITLGDFWGIGDTDKSWDDHKGTEVILVNNMKGRETFRQVIAPALKRCQEFSLDTATRINKTILHPFRQHPGRKHFFSTMELLPFDKLVEHSLYHNYDLGIVGLWYGINYGSVLTYYALYRLLRDFGYDSVMLPKPNTLWEERFNAPDSIAQRFIWAHCNVFQPFRSQSDYASLNDRCKDFIVGSDVVWNYDVCGRQSDQFFFLDWVEKGHKKIAFAASFGNGLSGPPEHTETAKYYLRQFDAISVREKACATALTRVLDNHSENTVEHVLDPVFLCNPDIWDTILSETSSGESAPFVFAYVLRHDMADAWRIAIKEACAHYDAVPKLCGNPNEMAASKKLFGDLLLPELSVENWLYYIKNCSAYIGDSYHGLCFSLIFHRPFLIIYAKAKYGYAGERFFSLLKLVGLEDRILENLDDPERCRAVLRTPIDWAAVDERLNTYRLSSRNWLKAALAQPNQQMTPEDYAYNHEQRKIRKLNKELAETKSKLEILESQLKKEENQIQAIYASRTWRAGRAVAWLPNKIRELKQGMD